MTDTAASFRMLQGYRAQMDRKIYKREMQSVLANYPNLEIRQAAVQDLVLSPPVNGNVREPGRQVVGLRVGKSTFALSVQSPSACDLTVDLGP